MRKRKEVKEEKERGEGKRKKKKKRKEEKERGERINITQGKGPGTCIDQTLAATTSKSSLTKKRVPYTLSDN